MQQTYLPKITVSTTCTNIEATQPSFYQLFTQLEGHDRVEGLLQGDGLQPELHVEEHGLSQPQKRPWTQKGSFPSSVGLF